MIQMFDFDEGDKGDRPIEIRDYEQEIKSLKKQLKAAQAEEEGANAALKYLRSKVEELRKESRVKLIWRLIKGERWLI